MLILSRKPGESIIIDGRITVKVIRLEGDMVKIGIEAPKEVPVHRQEVYDEIQLSNREALTENGMKLPKFSPGVKAAKPAPAQNNPPPGASNTTPTSKN
jgi:carbon storage regulator